MRRITYLLLIITMSVTAAFVASCDEDNELYETDISGYWYSGTNTFREVYLFDTDNMIVHYCTVERGRNPFARVFEKQGWFATNDTNYSYVFIDNVVTIRYQDEDLTLIYQDDMFTASDSQIQFCLRRWKDKQQYND